jgi:hypothetical protein
MSRRATSFAPLRTVRSSPLAARQSLNYSSVNSINSINSIGVARLTSGDRRATRGVRRGGREGGTCGHALTVERAQLFISPYRSRSRSHRPWLPEVFRSAGCQCDWANRAFGTSDNQVGRFSFFKSAANRGSLCKLFSRGSTFVKIKPSLCLAQARSSHSNASSDWFRKA